MKLIIIKTNDLLLPLMRTATVRSLGSIPDSYAEIIQASVQGTLNGLGIDLIVKVCPDDTTVGKIFNE